VIGPVLLIDDASDGPLIGTAGERFGSGCLNVNCCGLAHSTPECSLNIAETVSKTN
jgi:hypothetical protein